MLADGVVTPGSGGGSSWQDLYSGETTEEAIIQIPITGIAVKEIYVFCVAPTYANNFVLYAPIGQTEGNHYEAAGYPRMIVEVKSNTSVARCAYMHINTDCDVMTDGESIFHFGACNNTSTVNEQIKYDGGKTNMHPGMTINALSVATYQTTPAGTKIRVIGRKRHEDF
jgi:hypothetical protein